MAGEAGEPDGPPPLEETPPKIDGIRRFERLWVELLVARLLPGPFQGVGLVIGLIMLLFTVDELLVTVTAEVAGFGLAFLIPGTLLCAIVLAVPTVIAKRGGRVYLSAAGAVACAGIIGTIGVYLTRTADAMSVHDAMDVYDLSNVADSIEGSHAWLVMMFGVSAAAVGLVEGLYERSIATTYCGLLGGALSGAAGPILPRVIGASGGDPIGQALLAFLIGATVGNVGIGLSLALGRYIRDLPKRREKSDGEAPAPPQ